jgi:hypothetical protein
MGYHSAATVVTLGDSYPSSRLGAPGLADRSGRRPTADTAKTRRDVGAAAGQRIRSCGATSDRRVPHSAGVPASRCERRSRRYPIDGAAGLRAEGRRSSVSRGTTLTSSFGGLMSSNSSRTVSPSSAHHAENRRITSYQDREVAASAPDSSIPATNALTLARSSTEGAPCAAH